jgi:hypothetical protein
MLQPFLEFARAEYLRVCGDGLQALELFGALGRVLVAGDYPLWAPATGAWISTLAGLDRWEDALRLGLRSVVDAERAGLLGMKHYIDVPLGLVEGKLGRYDSARIRIEAAIAMREADGFEGATLGWVYEARARLAIHEHDEPSFEKYAQLCRQQYRKTGGNPALAAKYERLMQEARKSGAPVTDELAATLTRTSSAAALATTHARERDSTVRMKR